jgi:hypothetical protein
MSINTAKEIVCDRCKCSVRLDAPTLTEEWPELVRDGWRRVIGGHYCPACVKAYKASKST